MEQTATRKLGAYIKHLREERKHSVRGLAAKAGMNSGALSRIENGKRSPELDSLKALAVALDVTVTELITMGDCLTVYDLPSLTPYLHARYGHLPKEKLTSIDNYLKELIDDGLDLDGPLDLEDEYKEPKNH